MQRYLFGIILLLSFGALTRALLLPSKAQAIANHVVISEIQIAGATANDEFIELYNPTGSPVDLTNWRVSKKTQLGTESDIIASTMSGTIASHGYVLISHASFDGSIKPDFVYSGPAILASNNTVLLYDSIGTLVDKVGFGSASDSESSSYSTNPTAHRSIERKASATSTAISLATGGTEETTGNSEDTDNNAADFVLQTLSNPQNSASPLEPNPPTPTPIPTLLDTPTPEPTATPTEVPTPTPTLIPTATPEPTATPTPEPTATPLPTATPTPMQTNTPTSSPTLEPTSTPTPEPTISSQPSPSASPTPTPDSSPTSNPTPTPQGFPPKNHLPSPFTNIIGNGKFKLACDIQYKHVITRWFSFTIPQFHCVISRL